MPADSLAKHYQALTAPERFALLVEAMARRDGAEADRLEDTCPRFTYRQEDAEFRDRTRRALVIALMASLNLRAGLAQVRMAKLFREHYLHFADGPAAVAEVAFLYGRAYGRWEVGAAQEVDVPDQDALAAELEADPDLRRQLAEVRECAGEGMQRAADTLRHATGELHAADLLAQWEGFGRFCRESLGVGPLTLLGAFGLEQTDVAAEVLAACPNSGADNAEAAGWAGHWARLWDRRFGAGR